MQFRRPRAGHEHPKAAFSPEEARDLRQRYQQGATPRDLAEETGHHPSTIRRLVQKISYRQG